MTETLMSIRINPACQRIETAGKRPVGMDAATLLIEDDACAFVLIAYAQHGSASLGMLCDELGRCHAKATRKPQDFVRTDADRLVVTATGAGVAFIGERTFALKLVVDFGKRVFVRHDVSLP
jgi:hypothetical protein